MAKYSLREKIAHEVRNLGVVGWDRACACADRILALVSAHDARGDAERGTLSDEPLTFVGFSEMNRERCESPQGFNHSLASWSMSDWLTATMGELGEAANVAKKLNRIRDGIPGNKESEAELRWKLQSEIADTFIYLDLFAQAAGFRLGDVVLDTFNRKSNQIGYPARRLSHTGSPQREKNAEWQLRFMCEEIAAATEMPVQSPADTVASVRDLKAYADRHTGSPQPVARELADTLTACAIEFEHIELGDVIEKGPEWLEEIACVMRDAASALSKPAPPSKNTGEA